MYKRMFREIIGSEERCTNIALESFGICSSKPIMNMGMVYRHLRKQYQVNDYMSTRDSELSAIGDSYSEKFGKNIYGVVSIKHFINYIKSNDIEGHFFIFVRDHALAIHSLENGKHIFIIDAEEKFQSNSKIKYLLCVEGSNISKIFLDYIKTTERISKIKKI